MTDKDFISVNAVGHLFHRLMNYCVYFHINPLKHEVFYVGIGGPNRPYRSANRSDWWHRTVKKYGKIVDIVHENLTWESACEWEMYYIYKIGRRDLGFGPLVNLTDGGDGVLGLHHSPESRAKMSAANLGIPKSAAHRAAQSAASQNKQPWYRAKISAALTGKKKGPRTDETKAKIAEANRKRFADPEQRARLSLKLKGKPQRKKNKIHGVQ